MIGGALLGLRQVVLGVDGVVLGLGKAPAIGVDLCVGAASVVRFRKAASARSDFLRLRRQLVALAPRRAG